MNKKLIKLLLLGIFIILGYGLVYAQNEEITLKFSRLFGFSGGGKIQGIFSMNVSSSKKLDMVTFYIDSVEVGRDLQAPFSNQFNTDNFSPGEHLLYAIGYTPDGEEMKTRQERIQFITAEESRKVTLNLILPILGISLIAVLFSAFLPGFLSKNKASLPLGAQRNYGVAGGTICSRCKRPFARHMISPNLIFGKLDRCPHCGKWGIKQALPINILRQAEQEEIESSIASNNKTNDQEEEIHRELDSTKFQDM